MSNVFWDNEQLKVLKLKQIITTTIKKTYIVRLLCVKRVFQPSNTIVESVKPLSSFQRNMSYLADTLKLQNNPEDMLIN